MSTTLRCISGQNVKAVVNCHCTNCKAHARKIAVDALLSESSFTDTVAVEVQLGDGMKVWQWQIDECTTWDLTDGFKDDLRQAGVVMTNVDSSKAPYYFVL